MNIKGYEHLMKSGFPVNRNTILFRSLQEIPRKHTEAYGEMPRWAMRGFDYANTKPTDNPYELRESRAVHGFTKKYIRKFFQQIRTDLDRMQVPRENRIYLFPFG